MSLKINGVMGDISFSTSLRPTTGIVSSGYGFVICRTRGADNRNGILFRANEKRATPKPGWLFKRPRKVRYQSTTIIFFTALLAGVSS